MNYVDFQAFLYVEKCTLLATLFRLPFFCFTKQGVIPQGSIRASTINIHLNTYALAPITSSSIPAA
jgi:hypothetical protein